MHFKESSNFQKWGSVAYDISDGVVPLYNSYHSTGLGLRIHGLQEAFHGECTFLLINLSCNSCQSAQVTQRSQFRATCS